MSREVYVIYRWLVKARVYRRRSGRRRIQTFEVPASDRSIAESAASKHFKNAFLEEIIEMKPVSISTAFYKDSLEFLSREERAYLKIPDSL